MNTTLALLGMIGSGVLIASADTTTDPLLGLGATGMTAFQGYLVFTIHKMRSEVTDLREAVAQIQGKLGIVREKRRRE